MISALILGLAGLTAISFLLAHYWSEKRILSAFVHNSLPPSESTLAKALDLAALIYARVPRADDPRFIPIAALDFLGGTPVSIHRRGGCCSGLSRLYITGLGTLGIKAAQLVLYHATGQARHALVEVSLGEERVVVDPTYGFYYEDGSGGPIGLDALRRGVKPQYRRLPHSSNESYPATDYYNFDFSCTKTSNWTKTWIRRCVYRALKVLTAGRIDTLRQPPWMEWPQIVVATAVTMGVLTIELAVLFLDGATALPGGD